MQIEHEKCLKTMFHLNAHIEPIDLGVCYRLIAKLTRKEFGTHHVPLETRNSAMMHLWKNDRRVREFDFPSLGGRRRRRPQPIDDEDVSRCRGSGEFDGPPLTKGVRKRIVDLVERRRRIGTTIVGHEARFDAHARHFHVVDLVIRIFKRHERVSVRKS